MREVDTTDFESMVLNAIDSFMNVDKSFTSLDITNYIFQNISKNILHAEVASIVRKLCVEGYMEKNDYSGVQIGATINEGHNYYTTTLYYSTNNVFMEPDDLNINVAGTVKWEVGSGNDKFSKGKIVRVETKKYAFLRAFAKINSDGRLEIPQELLVNSKWLDNNRYISFAPESKHSFLMADWDCEDVIDFHLVIKNDRVKIPKTVFKMLGLPTEKGTEYEISYIEETDVLRVEKSFL